jgi:hypothetical protein
MARFFEETRMGQNLAPVGTAWASAPPYTTYNEVYFYLSEVAGFDMRMASEGGTGNHAMVFAEAEVLATSNVATTCGCVIKRFKAPISNSSVGDQENDAKNTTIADATVPFETAWWPILDVKLELVYDGSASPIYKHSLKLSYAIDENSTDVGVHWTLKCKIWKPQ